MLDLVRDRPAVGLPQVRECVGEGRTRDRHAQDPRGDLGHQLRSQVQRLGIERRVTLGLAAERVELRRQVAVRAVSLDQ